VGHTLKQAEIDRGLQVFDLHLQLRQLIAELAVLLLWLHRSDCGYQTSAGTYLFFGCASVFMHFSATDHTGGTIA
jgi:hypothetical protein